MKLSNLLSLLEKDDISSEIVGFRAKIVHSSTDVKIATLTPGRTIGVADDPVLHLELLIVAITDNEDGVVNLKPLELVLLPAVVRHFATLFISFSLGFLGSAHGTHTDVFALRQHTRFELLEFFSSLEVHNDGTVGAELSYDHLFCRGTVEAAKVANVLKLCDLRAVLVSRASLLEGYDIRGAFLSSCVERL